MTWLNILFPFLFFHGSKSTKFLHYWFIYMYMYFSIGGGTSWHREWWWRTTNLQSSQVANGLGWQAYPLLAVQATWPWAGNYLSYLGVGSIFPSSLFPLVEWDGAFHQCFHSWYRLTIWHPLRCQSFMDWSVITSNLWRQKWNSVLLYKLAAILVQWLTLLQGNNDVAV